MSQEHADTTISVVERFLDRSIEDAHAGLVVREEREQLALALTAWYQHRDALEPTASTTLFLAHDDPLSSVANGLVPTFSNGTTFGEAIIKLRALAPLVRAGAVVLAATEAPGWLGVENDQLTIADRFDVHDEERSGHAYAAEADLGWQRAIDRSPWGQQRDDTSYGHAAAIYYDWFCICNDVAARFLPTSPLEWE